MSDELIKSLQLLVDNQNKLIEPIVAMHRKMMDVVASVLQKIDQSRHIWLPRMVELLQKFDQLQRGFAEFSARLEPAALKAGQAGWTIPLYLDLVEMNSLLIRLVDGDDAELVFHELYLGSDTGARDALFEELVTTPSLEKWHPLIRECISSFNEARYIVCVPALISACEGAMVASGGATFVANQKVNPVLDHHEKALDGSENPLDRAVVVSLKAFFAQVTQRSDFAGPRPSVLNRHWILHGRDSPELWRDVDAIRLFQALHTISMVNH